MSVNMADSNHDEDLCRRMEAQEQTSRAQQEVLKNIQRMLGQLLVNRNIKDTSRAINGTWKPDPTVYIFNGFGSKKLDSNSYWVGFGHDTFKPETR